MCKGSFFFRMRKILKEVQNSKEFPYLKSFYVDEWVYQEAISQFKMANLKSKSYEFVKFLSFNLIKIRFC